MKKTFYEKVGSRYKPVYEYDQVLMDALPKGTHLIQVYPGGRCTRYNIDPNYAALIAAGRIAEEVISKKIMEASDLRPKNAPLTEGQKAAWANLIKEFGDSARTLEWPSAREAAEASVKAMTEEAEKLLQHPSVKKAWDHFHLICELVDKEQKEKV